MLRCHRGKKKSAKAEKERSRKRKNKHKKQTYECDAWKKSEEFQQRSCD